MSEGGLRGIVLAHGDMARGMVDAVRAIGGIDEDVLVPMSNRGLSPQSLAEQVRVLSAGRPTIVFADLPGGSCGFAARLLSRSVPGITVICGVNLPMLLDYVTHREMALEPLVERLVTKAKASIQSVTTPVRTDGDPAVQS